MYTIGLSIIFLLFFISSARSFIKLSFTESIREDQEPGHLVANVCENVKLSDHLPKMNNRQLDPQSPYRFKFRDNNNEYFVLDEKTCALDLGRKIDLEHICRLREPGCNVIVMTVNVWYKSLMEASIRTEIKIDDVNDNHPRFRDKQKIIHIPEVIMNVGTKIELPIATDGDYTKKFKDVKYSIDSVLADLTLDVTDGRPFLKLTKVLDRETRANYTFNLIAEDISNTKATIKIIVLVTNIDDNPPKFTKPLYVTSIPEDMPIGKMIFQLNATDLDTPANELKYYLSAKTDGDTSYENVFKVHLDGKITLKQKLDYEKRKMYLIPVKVRDTSQAGQSRVRIDVKDVNDCKPEYLVNPANLSVVEESDSLNPIGEIIVSDRDENGEATFRCSQNGGSSDVEIRDKGDGRSYEVKPHHSFDREKQSVIIAKLWCQDNGRPKSLSNEEIIKIHVADINDNSPVFNKRIYEAHVEEEQPAHTHVIKLKANDRDLGDNGRITYQISSHDNLVLSRFLINPTTGNITTNREFDREDREKYQFSVIAHDNGKPRRTATAIVKVVVMDINDNAPRLTSPSRFQVSENKPPNTHVGDLTAIDPDKGRNGSVLFTFSPGIQQSISRIGNYFNLYQNGSIFTKKKFDREVRSRYCMSVAMKDGSRIKPQVAVVTVCINVKDENDNKPVFKKPENESAIHHISIDDPPGQGILLVKAVDHDEGKNGMIHYALKSNERQLFSIDQISGEIKLQKSLTAADKGLYKLGVMASDQGVPQLTNFHVVNIKVEDGPRRLFGTFDWHDNRNVLIVVILSTVSAFLAIVLISAIICMVRPCGRSRRSPNILYKPATDDTWSPNSPDTRILQLPRVSNSGVSGPPTTIGMCVDSARPDCRGRLGSVTGSGTMPRKVRNPNSSLTRIKMDESDQAVRMWQYDPERARTQAVMGRIPGEHDRDHSDSGRGGSEDDLSSRVAAAGIGAVPTGPVLQTFQTIDRHHGLTSQPSMHPGGPPPISGHRLPITSTATLPTVKPQSQVVHIPLSTPSSSAATMMRDCPPSTYTQLSTLTRRGPNSPQIDPAVSTAATTGQNNLSGSNATCSSSSGSSAGSGSGAYERLHHRFPNSRIEPPVKETAIIDASQTDGSSNKVDAHKLVEEIDNLFFKDMMV